MTTRIHAPELDGDFEWLNTQTPLSLRELRGHVVVLDFWTYCCINCMHVLPVLAELEARFSDQPFAVIGVHSGKFDAERDAARIREAMGRYDIHHPVVVDKDFAIWSRFAVRSWPTLVVIRPDGTIAAHAPGEPEVEQLAAFVEKEFARARANGTLAKQLRTTRAVDERTDKTLKYPGKVRVLDEARLAVSDSGHHRVLVVNRSGEVLHTIGSGLAGFRDGAFDDAAFDDPQGVALIGDTLFVADARNHAIRACDLNLQQVTTIAGTGELALSMPMSRVAARGVALRSPWDLEARGPELFVAMAGSHEIWRYFADDSTIERFAGTGAEALVDGSLLESAWAQPSGLSLSGKLLWVADSETSAVRCIDLSDGHVRTLVGKGLFDFGDVDGPADEALLQHALGIRAHGDDVLVCDTYNGKVKKMDSQGNLTTLASGFSEPGALDVFSDGAIIVADTNAHRIVELRAGEQSVFEIRNARSALHGRVPRSGPARPLAAVDGWFDTILNVPDGAGLRRGTGALRLTLTAPRGKKIAADAPIAMTVEVSRRSDLLFVPTPTFSLRAKGGAHEVVDIATESLALPQASIEAELVLKISYVVCDAANESACFPGRVHVQVPVRLLREGGSEILEFTVPLADIE